MDDSPNPSGRRTGSDYPINNLHFTVDDDDKNIQRRSYDGLNSSDSNDLSDTKSLDGSGNVDMSTESKESNTRASDVKDDIPYREIVYEDHNRIYTE